MNELAETITKALKPMAGQGLQEMSFWACMGQFGISRDRKAHRRIVKELQNQGILKIYPGKGFEVTRPPSKDASEGDSSKAPVDAIALAKEFVRQYNDKVERLGRLEAENQMLREQVNELQKGKRENPVIMVDLDHMSLQ